jgi:prefoldin subunit 5
MKQVRALTQKADRVEQKFDLLDQQFAALAAERAKLEAAQDDLQTAASDLNRARRRVIEVGSVVGIMAETENYLASPVGQIGRKIDQRLREVPVPAHPGWVLIGRLEDTIPL